jgi:hypothetical protein
MSNLEKMTSGSCKMKGNLHRVAVIRNAVRITELPLMFGAIWLPCFTIQHDFQAWGRHWLPPRIAEFHCVIILPHGPNALRLSDVYAATIPTVVPEETPHLKWECTLSFWQFW